MTKVVIVGGSSAGLNVMNELITKAAKAKITVKITLIEKRSHYQHVIGNVRGAVDVEFSKKNWLPYSDFFSASGPGKGHTFVQGEVQAVYEKKVVLADGKEIEFDYLVYATGTYIPAPFRPRALNPQDGLKEATGYYNTFAAASRIVFIGGGPVSVETIGEIKQVFPKKEITLITSTEYLIGAKTGGLIDPKPAKALQDKLTKLGVEVITNEKVNLSALGLDKEGQALYEGEKTIKTSKGDVVSDLQVVAVGAYKPLSAPLKTLGDVLDSRGYVKVKATLQLESERYAHIFSLGDVAATGAPKMAIGIMGQTPIVSDNLIASITKKTLKLYDPNAGMKGIMVTLGKSDGIGYLHFFGGITLGGWMVKNAKGGDFMIAKTRTLLAVK
ncbi:Apoptosis-inducing factor 2 [Nowakowskiella sp. JEL0407]|nr:Apoptosis-inducing factor 2 [Nowakowskiella sp. JEL0407]